jgi:hypothetical protein
MKFCQDYLFLRLLLIPHSPPHHLPSALSPRLFSRLPHHCVAASIMATEASSKESPHSQSKTKSLHHTGQIPLQVVVKVQLRRQKRGRPTLSRTQPAGSKLAHQSASWLQRTLPHPTHSLIPCLLSLLLFSN